MMQVDAFTTTPFTGNAAAVVPDADELDPVVMQRIAREMNVSETAFILRSDEADWHIRWFSPTVEVALCGHATIAACHALVETGRMAVPGHYTIQTASGILDVELEPAENAPCRVWLDIPIPIFAPSDVSTLALGSALGLDESEFSSALEPIRGGEYLYIACNKLAALLTLKPDVNALRLLSHTQEVTGFFVYTLSGLSEESAVHARFFSPLIGIDEDPVTGSAHGPLGALLVGLGIISAPDDQRTVYYQAEQGDAIGRSGRVDVAITLDERGEPERARVGGVAVTVVQGQLRS
jgi:PhzF family phenazine biosynthesis protein